jgi:hypothetical protein
MMMEHMEPQRIDTEDRDVELVTISFHDDHGTVDAGSTHNILMVNTHTPLLGWCWSYIESSDVSIPYVVWLLCICTYKITGTNTQGPETEIAITIGCIWSGISAYR